jgi:myosin heavy subunit
VSETLRLILTKFTDETITIFSLLLLLTTITIIAYWLYNRKKFRELSHEIPASVVKNYLDSIIQNSNSLKSSLFRGGGLEIGSGIPSVVSVGDLPSTTSLGIGSGAEEVNQKNAEISMLKQNLNDRVKQIADLEKQLSDLSSGKGLDGDALKSAQAKVRELENQLQDAKKSGTADPQIQAQLTTVSNERNELRERLKEYEIIEEDLANLKRLQQENEQLRAEIAALKKGGAAPAPVAVTPAPVTPAAPPPAAVEEDDLEAEMAKAIAESKAAPTPPPPAASNEDEIPAMEGEQKSAEELLSEFEKMLG